MYIFIVKFKIYDRVDGRHFSAGISDTIINECEKKGIAIIVRRQKRRSLASVTAQEATCEYKTSGLGKYINLNIC